MTAAAAAAAAAAARPLAAGCASWCPEGPLGWSMGMTPLLVLLPPTPFVAASAACPGAPAVLIASVGQVACFLECDQVGCPCKVMATSYKAGVACEQRFFLLTPCIPCHYSCLLQSVVVVRACVHECEQADG